jgi:hypothetical protein
MTKLSRLMLPLRRAAQAFFRSEVALKRDETGLRLTLEERAVPQVARPPTAAELAADRRRLELKLMLVQLTEVLDEMPETRETMRHLVFVEQALRKKGLRALKKMPLEVLKRALDQFEGLITNWSPDGLANLRSKMAVAVIDRETFPDMTDPDVRPRTCRRRDRPAAHRGGQGHRGGAPGRFRRQHHRTAGA